MEPYQRLRKARIEAGFETAVDAARTYGWNEATYRSHENGIRGLLRAPAARYAKAFRKPVEWLLLGKGQEREATPDETARTVALVGYVGAGAETHFFGDQGELGRVPAVDGSSESTVAVEIRGDSLGSFFDRWLVYYDDVRRPITADLLGKLCVVGLDDGRILIKKIQRSKAKGLFHLLSQTEAPILDVELEWAARVKTMVPR